MAYWEFHSDSLDGTHTPVDIGALSFDTGCDIPPDSVYGTIGLYLQIILMWEIKSRFWSCRKCEWILKEQWNLMNWLLSIKCTTLASKNDDWCSFVVCRQFGRSEFQNEVVFRMLGLRGSIFHLKPDNKLLYESCGQGIMKQKEILPYGNLL